MQHAEWSGRFFLPGPTEVLPEILEAQARPMIGHRGSAIEELIGELEQGLQDLFVTGGQVFVFTSSATGAMEAGIRNGVGSGAVLSLVNGAFSHRFADIAAACGRQVEVWEVPWGAHHDPDGLADRLAGGRYDAVTLTHSETSTGVLQDLEAMAAVVAEVPGTLLLVDSVTGLAGTEVRSEEWGLDFVLTGSQKALALPPGLAFAAASPILMERAAQVPDRGVYFDLVAMAKSLDLRQTPSTPAVSLLYALQAQLRRISEETLQARWKRHAAMRDRTVEWVTDLSERGIGLLASEGHRSPTITCVTLPDELTGPGVVKGMKERGWVIGGGYGKLRDTTIRIGHMGDHTVDELDGLLDALGEVLG